MPNFIIVSNPLQPLKDAKRYDEPGFTIADFIRIYGVDMAGKVCLLDSAPVDAADYGVQLNPSATVVICPEVHGVAAVLFLLSLAISVALYFMIDVPPASTTGEDGLPEADPVYTLRGQKNQSKLSSSIERHYGRTRHWPSYMARPYTTFIGNDQYLYALLCVGLGEYDIESIMIEDTPIGNFADVFYTVYQPGEQVTAFPTNVQTSTEVGGTELYGPNEPDYEGWTGPFSCCSAGNRAYQIDVDASCRQGLYSLDSNGKPTPSSVTIEAEARLIDDAGSPLGSWFVLFTEEKTGSTNKPQRYTISTAVASGRYEVRVRRTSSKDDSFRIRHTIHWEGLRSFCETDQDFGNVTLIAISARATDNLNDSTKNGFNVISTSKLPVYNEGTGVWTMTATRNPVWAAIDVLRARYGRRLTAPVLDLPAFCSLAADLDTEELYFDGTFDQRTTVWGAMQSILSVARAVPVVPAGVISVVRDVPRTIPTLGFNGHNIGKDTFVVHSRLTRYSDTDGIEVEYIDGVTWKRRTVLCLLGADRGVNPRQVRLIGCTDRDLAYRWGMYQRSVEVYQLDNITFETGLEGGTAVYGDLVAVKHELLPADASFEVSSTGRLAYGAFSVESGHTVITLPTLPTFLLGETHRISVRDKLGELRGPYSCTAHSTDPYKVVLATIIDTTNILVPVDREQPLFWFGVSGKEYQLFRVVKLEPSGTHKIKVTGVPYDERLYAYDTATAPALDNDYNLPSNVNAPPVTGLSVDPVAGVPTEVTVSWAPATGAEYYIIQTSLDGLVYDNEVTTTFTSYLLTVFAGDLWIKVYAFKQGAGTPATWSGVISAATTAPDPITGLAADWPFVGTALGLQWDDDPMAIRYRLQFYLGATLIGSKTTTNDHTNYPVETAIADAAAASVPISRDVTVEVRGENAMGDGTYCTPVTFSNPLPMAPYGLASGSLSGGFYPVSWTHGVEADLLECRVYASATNGFTPGSGNLVDTVPAFGSTSSIASSLRYWRVASVDKWGVEESMSAQAALW